VPGIVPGTSNCAQNIFLYTFFANSTLKVEVCDWLKKTDFSTIIFKKVSRQVYQVQTYQRTKTMTSRSRGKKRKHRNSTPVLNGGATVGTIRDFLGNLEKRSVKLEAAAATANKTVVANQAKMIDNQHVLKNNQGTMMDMIGTMGKSKIALENKAREATRKYNMLEISSDRKLKRQGKLILELKRQTLNFDNDASSSSSSTSSGTCDAPASKRRRRSTRKNVSMSGRTKSSISQSKKVHGIFARKAGVQLEASRKK